VPVNCTKCAASIPCLKKDSGSVVWVLQQISYVFQQCKNYEKRLTFDKVTESLTVGTFLRRSVVFAATVLQNVLQNVWNHIPPSADLRSLHSFKHYRKVDFSQFLMYVWHYVHTQFYVNSHSRFLFKATRVEVNVGILKDMLVHREDTQQDILTKNEIKTYPVYL